MVRKGFAPVSPTCTVMTLSAGSTRERLVNVCGQMGVRHTADMPGVSRGPPAARL